MVAIKTVDLTQDFKSVADRIIRGEKILISRPRNENIVMITEKEYNELADARKKAALERLRENFKAMQEQSVINGTNEMTMEEINDIIAEVRLERGHSQ